ncbi:MAG: Ni/Fe hydrogenase subunit alpha [Deltaproteobacteria bacterium]|nr:Ni/Fe hydrogenase subunit alpha [Deltaproteobacteria bacterium]MBW2151216.1 Ni/Fe hydrogenase subunit alpha [Deltaproteobacteria bacterium]
MNHSRKITINPISRLEGHGKVTIHLDTAGEVQDACFHVTQVRGFERFCEGRPFEEMPIITQRICGICPVSHQLASAKACDVILGVEIPETAKLLRELEHMGQFIQSHALHFFHLASPDLLLGWDSDPAKRNVVGVVEKFPEIALKGIKLRKFGQEIIEALGGKKIHPAFAIPGGVTNPLIPEKRETLLSGFDDAYGTCETAIDIIKDWVEKNLDEVKRFANFESNYAGLMDENGSPNMYEGRLRITDHKKTVLAEFAPNEYLSFIGEHVEPWSYLKFPFYKPKGYPEGGYRVGPLGRLNAADHMSTLNAYKEFREYRKMAENGLRGCSLLYHYARLIELLNCMERAEAILKDDRICGTEIRITAGPSNTEGVGVIEAPRGTLIHHYRVDKYGAIQKVNLIVATGHNNIAMNRSVELVAKEYIHNGEVKEGILNRVECAIRCYDPCLSCSTHALGQMALKIQIYNHEGKLLHEVQRN